MNITLNQLKKIQERCDQQSYFIKKILYPELTPIQILKHNCFHLAKLTAKIAHLCEQEEHDIIIPPEHILKEVIPDLIIYALQFANAYNLDLETLYEERLKFVITKYSS